MVNISPKILHALAVAKSTKPSVLKMTSAMLKVEVMSVVADWFTGNKLVRVHLSENLSLETGCDS